MVKPTNINSDYREEERLTCVLVLDTFNNYTNEIVSHTSLPLCLWPVDGRPLLDYTIHTLIRSGIQEIILLATSYSYEIRSYIMNSHWLQTYPKLIRFIPCKEARSLGDCLKDLEQENIINNHFILLYGNGTLITNEKLNNLFNIHKENIKKDKNCIMTLVYRQLDSNHFEHPSYTDDQHLCIIRDANTYRLYDYSTEYLDRYEISLDLLEKPNVTIETLYCPLDCHVAVCSPDVLHLFKDNFDYSTINEFVKGIVRDEEIAGHTIYSYLYETGYFLSVHNLRLYMKATFDILRRWSYPLVPEIIASMHKQQLSTITNPTLPQIKLNDSYLSFYNICYPIIYDKHNIYKQGDIQLDRLSNIQQDVFIGYKSQILSGVCLRSSLIGQSCIIGKNTKIENSIIWNHVQIGENCIIKNSIICDNVVIRNNVQIDKECILCKNVIIGTNVHLNQHMTIIASNSITSTNVVDEIEIDEDISAPLKNVKRSNSKQRSSSTMSSEKSVSEKSISLSIEETITSNSDLVGIDGFGRQLSFISTHDDQTKPIEHTDDDDDDINDNDKSQLNAFDAWGYRIEPIENRDLSHDDEDNEIKPKQYRLSNLKKPSDQPSDIQSEDENSEIDDSEDPSSETGSINETNDVSEFQQEVIRTLERAYRQKLHMENIIVELNMLKPTYDVSPTEFDRSIVRAVFLLPFEKKISNSETTNYWNSLKLTMDQITQFILKNYMKITNEQSQISLLNGLDSICLKHIQPIGERIVNILNYLYENDVIDEQWILQWYENKQEKIENNELIIKPEEKIYYDKLKQFVEWLQNAESEDDDQDDED
ncbi:unnamed protein product [Rotaria sordida]|uniref:Translation initiation factor eIF2B subunit epsilon n=1 Tax=Rotaria sordida TaxID=392033 RepID=A0A815GF72_9BILA|nr:unnamed protein product [Rotaria sordida]CAF1371709.1 unnamed protein product [Rotaria sordida]CAF1611935.1 unnamed protein product [Rotaria sordida]CAF3668234.1 unnamed protein product [Rotaria sordida]